MTEGFDAVVAAIAAQAPNWEPGSQHGYHARSFGWILGELMHRVTGLSLEQYLQREICEPLGLRYWVGLPSSEMVHCATMVPPKEGANAVLFNETCFGLGYGLQPIVEKPGLATVPIQIFP